MKFLSGEFSSHFPAYTVKINKDCNDAKCLFVSIYGVPVKRVDEVESRAYDIIKEVIVPKCCAFMPTPEIVDDETTKRYYPAFMPAKPIRETTALIVKRVAKSNRQLAASF
jgi:hypothetical protein